MRASKLFSLTPSPTASSLLSSSSSSSTLISSSSSQSSYASFSSSTSSILSSHLNFKSHTFSSSQSSPSSCPLPSSPFPSSPNHTFTVSLHSNLSSSSSSISSSSSPYIRFPLFPSTSSSSSSSSFSPSSPHFPSFFSPSSSLPSLPPSLLPTTPFRTSLTIGQLVRRNRKKRVRASHVSAFEGAPMKKGTCLKVFTQTPRKPNSALRKVCRIVLSNKKEINAYIPGVGHNLQKHSVVFVRGGRTPDLPGYKYVCVRSLGDLRGVEGMKRGRSKFGTKRVKSDKNVKFKRKIKYF